jgi:hypothetical protein
MLRLSRMAIKKSTAAMKPINTLRGMAAQNRCFRKIPSMHVYLYLDMI